MFLTTDPTLFRQNTYKTENNAIKMSPAFQDITQFERFTGLNLLEDYYLMVLNYFLLAVMVEGAESSRLRMAK